MRSTRIAVRVLMCLCAAVTLVRAQSCIEYDALDPYDVPRLWDHPGFATPTRAATRGETAFVLDEDGMKILDLAALPDVTIVATMSSSVYFYDVDVFKDRLYLATEHGLRVLDISDPETPTITNILEPGTTFRTLLLDGGRLFASGGAGSLLIDVAGGGDEIVARWTMPGPIQSMTRLANVLWCTNQSGDLLAYDITDTHKVSRIPFELEVLFSGDLIAVGQYLMAGDVNSNGDMISVIDVSDPTAPTIVTRFAANDPMALFDQQLIVGDKVYNVADPTSPYLTGSVTPFDIVLPTTPAVGLVTGFGWEAVDLDLPWYPVLAAARPVRTDFGPTAIHDGMLFAGNGVWNLETPDVPELLSDGYSVNFYRGWDSYDAGMHYQERREGVLVTELSDPSAPRKLGMFRLRDLVGNPGPSFLMSVIDGLGYYLYQSVPGFTGRPTLAVFDMGDPVHPKQIGSMQLTTVFDCIDMMKIGDVLYVMTGVSGCRMVDVSDPTAPYFLATLPGRAPSTKLIREGDLLGMVMSTWGIDLYNVADPYSPVYKGRVATNRAVVDATFSGDHVFTLADGMIHIFDISHSPILLGSFRPPARVAALDASPERLLVATKGGGWFAYAPDCGTAAPLENQAFAEATPPPVRSLRVAPNPFNPHTTVSWDQERPESVLVTIHDLSGRRVATLAEGQSNAGHHAVIWNGTDDSGRAQATGAYMVSLRRDDSRDVRKVLLIR